MAIDPSISLGVKSPEMPTIGGYLGMAQTAQDIINKRAQLPLIQAQTENTQATTANTRAGTANLQAQNPGLVAESKKAVLGANQAQGKNDAAANAIETDADGNPIVDPATGMAKINQAKYVTGLFKAGLGDDALKAQHDILVNTDQQQKNTNTQLDMNASVRNQLALQAKAAYDESIATNKDPVKAQADAKAVWESMAGRALTASKNNVPGYSGLTEDQLAYTPGIEHQLYTAQITPGAQEQLKISQGNLNLGWANNSLATKQFENSRITSFTDKDSMDPSSPASQRARDIIKNTTGEVVPDSMSLGELFRNPKYQQTLSSVGNNVGVAKQKANEQLNAWQNYDAALDRAKGKLSNLGLTPGNFAENFVSKNLGSDPDLAALYAAGQQLPPGSVSTGLSWDAAKAVNGAMIDGAKRNLQSAGGNTPGASVVPGSGSSPTVSPGKPVSQPTAGSPASAAPGAKPAIKEGSVSTSKSGKPIVYKNGRWEYQ